MKSNLIKKKKICYFCSSRYGVFLLFIGLFHQAIQGMIYSYFFYDPLNNPDYFNNLQESPTWHPFNSRTPSVTCSSILTKNPVVDPICIKSKYGMHFPESNDVASEIAGNLDINKIYNAYPDYTLLMRIYIDPKKE